MKDAARRDRRASRERVLEQLRLAARKGDRAALALALDEMRTLALSPRYWTKYLTLLQHPLARLVDLLAIKQGDRIAQQKGWTKPSRRRKKPRPAKPAAPRPRPSRRATTASKQPSLFPDF